MKLIEKIFEIKNNESMQYFQKTKDGFKGKYVPGVDLLTALNPLMKKHRVMLMPSIEDAQMDGKNVMLKKVLTWIDVDSGETLPIKWVDFGTAEDLSQAEGKALTYNERFYFMKAFQIATDNDDPETFQEKNKPKVEMADKQQLKEILSIAKTQGYETTDITRYMYNTWKINDSKKLTHAQAEIMGRHFGETPKTPESEPQGQEGAKERAEPTHLTGKYPRDGMREEDEEFRASFIKKRDGKNGIGNFVHSPENRKMILYVKETYPDTFAEMRSRFFKYCTGDDAKFPFDEPRQ